MKYLIIVVIVFILFKNDLLNEKMTQPNAAAQLGQNTGFQFVKPKKTKSGSTVTNVSEKSSTQVDESKDEQINETTSNTSKKGGGAISSTIIFLAGAGSYFFYNKLLNN